MIAEHGVTAWGHAWLRTVEPTRVTRPNPSLPRARNLARGDGITDLTMAPGLLTAGSGQYRVRIEIPLWPAEPAALAAKLLADLPPSLVLGDLPDSLAAELRAHDIDIAPPPEELTPHCDCRDRRPLCVHVLAALYALVQAVDERPALAVELRGVTATTTDPDWIPVSELSVAGFYG
ncbi:SWIM zinc finger family protein [Crossiella sp. SN42]|uniref:SWIM zinc finger family protein n=1 Tax=Crossiella sp. SN42 TaxID=2944808 RepID=UPI00207CD40C|nr:SWIM zinc finger family protein [Crossiella sp. SN42]MCO1581183.1 SWIM zinc finger family protein [Crossiella sp. SN42]